MESPDSAVELCTMSDEQLAVLCQMGRQEAFGELSVRYIGIIRSRAEKYFNIGMDAEDLFQEGLIGLDSAVRTYEAGSSASFRTYASVCISNCIVSAVRAANSKKNVINNSAVSLTEELDVPSSSDTEPESALMEDESYNELFAKMKDYLSVFELEVVLLFIEGYGYDEIAAALGVGKKSCESAMQRVRKKLRKLKE